MQKNRNKVPHLEWMVKQRFDGGTNAAGYDPKLGGISAFDQYGNAVYNVQPLNYNDIVSRINTNNPVNIDFPEVVVTANSPFRDTKKAMSYIWQNMVLDLLGLNWKSESGLTNEIDQKTKKPTGRGALVPNYTFESWMPSPGAAYRWMTNFADKAGSKIAGKYLLGRRLNKLDDYYKSVFKGFYDQLDPVENAIRNLPRNQNNILPVLNGQLTLPNPKQTLSLPNPKDKLLLPGKHFANIDIPSADAGLSDVGELSSHNLVDEAIKNTAQNGLGLFVDKEGNVNEANFNNFINNVYAKNPLGSYYSHTATEKPSGLPGSIYEVIPYDQLLANSPGPGLTLSKRRDLLGHTRDVVHTALDSPVPKGSTKQEQVFSALFHDVGKLTGNRKHEGKMSTYLLDQLGIGIPDNVREAIARHMSRNTRDSKNALLKATQFADVARGLDYDDAAFRFPYLEYQHESEPTKYASNSPSEMLKTQIGPWAKEHKYQSFGDWSKSKGLKTAPKDVTEQLLSDYVNDLIDLHLTWIRGVNDPGKGKVAQKELDKFGGRDTKEARLRSAATFTPPKQLAGRAYMFNGPDEHGAVSSRVKVNPKDHDVLYASNSAGVGLEYSGGNPNASGSGGVYEVKLPLPEGLMDIKNPAERLAKADYAIYGAQLIKNNLNPTGIYQMFVDPYRLATGRNLIKDVLDKAGVKPSFTHDWPSIIGKTTRETAFDPMNRVAGVPESTEFHIGSPKNYGSLYVTTLSDFDIYHANQILSDAGINNAIRIYDTKDGKKLYFPKETGEFVTKIALLDRFNQLIGKRTNRNSLLGEVIDNVKFLKDHKEDPGFTDPHFSSLLDKTSAQLDIIDGPNKIDGLRARIGKIVKKLQEEYTKYGFTDHILTLELKANELRNKLDKYEQIFQDGTNNKLPEEQQLLYDESKIIESDLAGLMNLLHRAKVSHMPYSLGISDRFLDVLYNNNIPLSTKLLYLNNPKYFQKLMRDNYFNKYVKLFDKNYNAVDIKKLQEDRAKVLTPANLAKQMRENGVLPFYDSDRINSPMVITLNGDGSGLDRISVNPTDPHVTPMRIHVVGGKNDEIFDANHVRRMSTEELANVNKVKRRHNESGSDKKSKSRKISHKNLASLIPLLLGSGIAANKDKKK